MHSHGTIFFPGFMFDKVSMDLHNLYDNVTRIYSFVLT